MSASQHLAVEEVPGVVRALRVLRDRWWVVVLSALVCIGAALAVSLRAPKSYKATSKVLFRDPGLTTAVSGGNGGFTLGDPASAQATNVLLVTTNEVAAAVRRELNGRYSDRELLSRVSATTEANANVVDITVSGTNAGEDAQIANLWAQQFTKIRQQADRDKVAQGVSLLQQQLAGLPAISNADDRAQLRTALAKLTTIEAVQTGNAEIVDLASRPTTPASPKPKQDAIIALIIGTVLGAALAFVLELFDRRLKGVDDFEAAYGTRVLATIPLRPKKPSNNKERAAALEPFRILRNGLNVFTFPSDLRVVMVTSALPGEGKTTVAAGLATAIALSGHAVVLIEADMRRPTLHHHFELGHDRRGLATALIERVDPRELLRPGAAGLSSLSVLPSGPQPPNTAELLGSAEMATVIDRLRGEAEFIILDAPPLLPVADAQVLLDHPQINACLIVGRALVTQREDARRAAAVIERHRLSNVGLVVNAVRKSGAYYEYYGSSEVALPSSAIPTPRRGEGELAQISEPAEAESARQGGPFGGMS